MKQTVTMLICAVVFTSCATTMNRSFTAITIHTTQPSKIVIKSDTLKTVDNERKIYVTRSKAPIHIIVLADSLKKEITLNARGSFAWYANIFYNYGLGMLVDRKNPKRYTYPTNLYLNSTDTSKKYSRYRQLYNKGELYLTLSLPYINSFLLKPENETTKSNTGFWGIRAGLDYFHTKNQFLNLSVNALSDFFVPVPAAIDISGEYEIMSSAYLSLSNNHIIRRFSLGYGIAYARNTWELRYAPKLDPPPPTRAPVKKSHYSLGLISSAYYQAGKRFNMGIIYRPGLLRFATGNHFQYEHLISLDLGWKIRLKGK